MISIGYKNILLIAIFLANIALAKEITQSAVSTQESKILACSEALKIAQKEALHISGINIFTSFERVKTMSESKIKNIIKNNTTQSSYGSIKTISKKESISFDGDTGLITCEVFAKFEVDTSKLKSQLLASSQKYDNIYKAEKLKSKAINSKIKLMQKYKNIQSKIQKYQTFHYDGRYSCGEDLGAGKCKLKLQSKINNYFKNKLSDKYDIRKSDIKEIKSKLINKIKLKEQNGFFATYKGKVKIKALIINPFLDEIESLTSFADADTKENWYETLIKRKPQSSKKYTLVDWSINDNGDFSFRSNGSLLLWENTFVSIEEKIGKEENIIGRVSIGTSKLSYINRNRISNVGSFAYVSFGFLYKKYGNSYIEYVFSDDTTNYRRKTVYSRYLSKDHIKVGYGTNKIYFFSTKYIKPFFQTDINSRIYKDFSHTSWGLNLGIRLTPNW